MGFPGSSGSKEDTGFPDQEIVDRVLAGELDFFEELIRRHREAIFRLVRSRVPKEMVDEIAHDVFVEAYRSLPAFQKDRRFAPWLGGIAVHLCSAYWRRRYRERSSALSSFSDEPRRWLERLTLDQSRRAFHQEETQQAARELLEWALGRLPVEERTALELTYLEGRSHKEAAELLGWSVARVKMRSFRARRKMRNHLLRLLRKSGGYNESTE